MRQKLEVIIHSLIFFCRVFLKLLQFFLENAELGEEFLLIHVWLPLNFILQSCQCHGLIKGAHLVFTLIIHFSALCHAICTLMLCGSFSHLI